MKVSALGHIAFLLEMEPEPGARPLRILGDPWLSDYVLGDLMGRWPRLRFESRSLGPLDAIWLSHSHTDHLDPPSLLRLHRELTPAEEPPKLLIPTSLRHLGGLFARYLPSWEPIYLDEGERTTLRGIELSAFFSPEVNATNEDDVMVLLAESAHEVFVSESDALLPFYDPELREYLGGRMGREGVESAVFLTAKNELGPTMSMLAAKDRADREARLSESFEATYAEIRDIFCPLEELEDDLWTLPNVVRLVGGQGMCYPQALVSNWNRVLFPARLADRARMEREIAGQVGYRPHIESFEPGECYTVERGQVSGHEALGWLELLDEEKDRGFDPTVDLYEDDFPCRPSRRRSERDEARQEELILEALNTRFLPWLIGARRPPLEHLLAGGGGEYRLRARFGDPSAHRDLDFSISFAAQRFAPGEASSAPADEHYWADDLEDFLSGEIDEFSCFCRRPLPGRSLRFWRCLGLPYLNADLVHAKLDKFFARAEAGENLEAWVLSRYAED